MMAETALFTVSRSNLRIEQDQARRILPHLVGRTGREALHAVRFTAGMVSAPLATVIADGVAKARTAGLGPEEIVVGTWEVGDGDEIMRMRRMAHGLADWITTATTMVSIDFEGVTSA